MSRLILSAATLLLLPLAAMSSPAAARNYDCSKAGNANKTACKGATATTTSATKSASKPAATRNYDCSKAGNANKAVCKGSASAAPSSAPTPATKSARNYDCSKPGNANKTVCKGAVTTSPPSSGKSATAAPRRTASTATNVGPNSATAKCNDGTMSYSAHRAGTCSHHGGVATWY